MGRKASRGKKLPFLYYTGSVLRRLIPRPVRALQRRLLLRGWEKRSDADYIRSRVDFYCRRVFKDNEAAIPLGSLEHLKCQSAYLVDAQRTLRSYPSSTCINFRPGDTPVGTNPKLPTIIRSRRLDDDCDNGVLLNLDSRRHFLRPVDPIPFGDKMPLLFFRGEMEGKPHRQRFLQLWKDSVMMDIGDTNRPYDAPGHKPPVPIVDHFKYRYILSLEGNDVASALQWIMASNCVPVMIRPTVEGWLMHSRLIPGVHYIEIAPDFSDVEQKILYYNEHPQEAERIAGASKKWASQFFDSRREGIISYLVVDKYLGQDV
ncbi:MAG: glycosyl transferase family 90 [Clostridium sp.]|nr:glycosyl transferase family 90 [Prevotella sp.]MCM1429617.1 glycosyl transferase family 90 [Clostridium sp.]MCM1476096.1 glycosyl transferase family 90 [Muribaculaceae bacterium]